MKQSIKRTVVAILSICLLVPTGAGAHPGHDHGTTDGEPTESQTERAERYKKDLQATLQSKKDERKANAETRRADPKERLDNEKKKICEHHQSKINRIVSNMNDHRQYIFDRITNMSDAVQRFYTEKNLSIDNYNETLAKVAAAKSAAEEAMSAQHAATTLNCNGNQPRADMSEFKEKRSSSIDAMTLYRAAVKELVSAVKQAAKDAREAKGVE